MRNKHFIYTKERVAVSTGAGFQASMNEKQNRFAISK